MKILSILRGVCVLTSNGNPESLGASVIDEVRDCCLLMLVIIPRASRSRNQHSDSQSGKGEGHPIPPVNALHTLPLPFLNRCLISNFPELTRAACHTFLSAQEFFPNEKRIELGRFDIKWLGYNINQKMPRILMSLTTVTE